jgi:putative Ca2+/H+ antiporter (TMEM165/GDT1 family)
MGIDPRATRRKVVSMLTAILISLSVVFVAELGDKSQLMTMTYALRHKWWVVLAGVGIASFLVHGLSVTIGHFLGLTLPEKPIAFAAAIAFFAFAFWTWREARSGGGDEGPKVAEPRFVLLAVISSFVLAELGDKTMLATVALASDHNWAGVWIGATAGMVLADGVAIAVGAVMHKRLPVHFLHSLASVLFLLFGLWILFDGALGLRWAAVGTTAAVALAAPIALLVVRKRSAAAKAAESLEIEPEPSEPSPGYRTQGR